MRPPSTTIPLPIRSSPRMRMEGWPLGTVAWILTIVGSSSLTNSGETSMTRSAPSHMTGEERLDAPMPRRVGGGIVADGGAAAAARLVAVLHILEHGLLLSHNVEVVVGTGVEHDGGVGSAAAHGLDHLRALARQRPVVDVADEQQERPHHLL